MDISAVEKIMQSLVETQQFYPNDELTKIIEKYGEDELDMDELYQVAAAYVPAYNEFLKKIQDRDK